MSMFKLLRCAVKKFHGLTVRAEGEHVAIYNMRDQMTNELCAAIELSSDTEHFVLLIPADKIASVIDRLQEIAAHIETQNVLTRRP